MEPETLSKIAVSNSAAAFFFSVLVTIPLLALLFASISITSGVFALDRGARRGATILAIVLSSVWLLYLVVMLV